ncbi:hypothetical protein B5M09_004316 [Aphanomyces astaci]|uniref:PH domain-containing protein n=1 Tax=Aphanomyces astaci TaxID=112090 RepID=A0A3R7WPI1_APHAT|nr:hypothetical protein B5M09_004316 [Aphanomyces astaci]
MHAHHDFTCGFLDKSRPPPNSATPFSGHLTRVFLVLITSRLDIYKHDPRPSFKAAIHDSFPFDRKTKVLDCADVYSGLPPFTFSITTNGNTMLLTATSYDDMLLWLDAIRNCLDNQVHILRGTLWKKSARRPQQPWVPRDVELGHISLTYVTTRLHQRVRNHVKLTSRSFVVNLEATRGHAHVFGISTGDSTITLAAPSADVKARWLKEVEIRIAKQRIQRRVFQKPFDLAGFVDVRKATKSKWRRRFVELERGALAFKSDQRRVGMSTHVPLELITAVVPTPPADESGRSLAFAIERFGAVTLYMAAFSAAEKLSWLTKLDLARRDVLQRQYLPNTPTTVLFPQAMQAILAHTGYRSVVVAEHEELDMTIEQHRRRIFVVVPTECEDAATVLVKANDATGKHVDYDAMWHLLRVHARPIKLTFRLPISKDGLLRVKTDVPVPHGTLRWFSLQKSTDDDNDNKTTTLAPLHVLRLRDCSVTLLRDLDPDFGHMPNCFVLTYSPPPVSPSSPMKPHATTTDEKDKCHRTLFSASSAKECVLWMSILQVEICTFNGDTAYGPIAPPLAERRRNTFVSHVKVVADKVYAKTKDTSTHPEEGEEEGGDEVDGEGARPPSPAADLPLDGGDDDDDDEFLSVTERLHRHFVERPGRYLQATKEDVVQRTATYVRQRRQSLEATPIYRRLSEAKVKIEQELAPAREEAEKAARKVADAVHETMHDVRQRILIPDPETSDYFNGCKRYLDATVLGTSARTIEYVARKKAVRFIETESIVQGLRRPGILNDMPTGSALASAGKMLEEGEHVTLTEDAARAFFVEVSGGKPKTSHEAVTRLLRHLCTSELGHADMHLCAFEGAMTDLQESHVLTYAISIDVFVSVAVHTIRDRATIKGMHRFANGVVMQI